MKSKEIDDYLPGYKYPYVLKDFAEDLYGTYFNRIDAYDKNSNAETFMVDWLASRFYVDSKILLR